MAWYDKYKDDKILINREEEHNKFWIVRYDPTTHDVITKWGRVGTKGQSKTFHFSGSSGAFNHIRTKEAEKRRKGYTIIDASALQRMTVEASLVGSNNKCVEFRWGEFVSYDDDILSFDPVEESRIMHPDCNPVPMFLVTMRDQTGELNAWFSIYNCIVFVSTSVGNGFTKVGRHRAVVVGPSATEQYRKIAGKIVENFANLFE